MQLFCKLAVLCDILLHVLIFGFLMKLAMLEIIFVPFGVAVLMIAVLSALFYTGIVIQSDDLMIPMIVAKVCFSINYLLSIYSSGLPSGTSSSGK